MHHGTESLCGRDILRVSPGQTGARVTPTGSVRQTVSSSSNAQTTSGTTLHAPIATVTFVKLSSKYQQLHL